MSTAQRDHELPDGFGVVVGNCQAESLRIVLDAPDRPTVRVPAVHEMTAADAERLHALLRRASFLVAQPVREDYHGLPLGTRQLAASLPATAALVTFPVVRYAGLHPFQAALHVPGVDEVPPVVAYHDVRTLAALIGLPVRDALDREGVLATADDSLAELRRREQDIDVAVSDLLHPTSAELMRTVNHPGNPIWMPLGERVLDALGDAGEPTDPGRPLLNSVRAPLEPWVVDAWGLSDEPHPHWLVGGVEIDPAEVAEAHIAWYRRHPLFVEGATTRLRATFARWRS
ncbi:WcbI family polysaccharide biosynthesis putative acetyltransferase [Microbacterium oleivorans]|uniref:WcbI family polysaccharide biosynthesis putative acetyltransferase n=1 Tax=Microbacterium oleivorans TaxID=273677 RepID=UPI002116C835|nr:WcbI family polysaccharide biosynthesis putative acetyltransferase [Microbacterium oleivorans]